MKTVLLLLMALFNINAVIAQTTSISANQCTKEVVPPASICKRFLNNFPNTNPTWDMEGDNYIAQYKDDITKRNRLVFINKNGNIVRSDSEMDGLSYPPAIVNFYHDTHPNEIFNVWISEDNNGNRTYYSVLDTCVLWFDGKGNYAAKIEIGKNKSPQNYISANQ